MISDTELQSGFVLRTDGTVAKKGKVRDVLAADFPRTFYDEQKRPVPRQILDSLMQAVRKSEGADQEFYRTEDGEGKVSVRVVQGRAILIVPEEMAPDQDYAYAIVPGQDPIIPSDSEYLGDSSLLDDEEALDGRVYDVWSLSSSSDALIELCSQTLSEVLII